MLRDNKILKLLNEIFDENKFIRAESIQKYQEPHNYEPSPEVMQHQLNTLRAIQIYEKNHGPSCAFRDANGILCRLKAGEHKMQRGVLILVKKGTTTQQVVDEICRVTRILEEGQINGIAQHYQEEIV